MSTQRRSWAEGVSERKKTYMEKVPLYGFQEFADRHYKAAAGWSFPEGCYVLFEHLSPSGKGYGSSTSVNTRFVLNHCQDVCGGDLFNGKPLIRVNVDLRPVGPTKNQQLTDAFGQLLKGGGAKGVPVLCVPNDKGGHSVVTEDRAISGLFDRKMVEKVNSDDRSLFTVGDEVGDALLESLMSTTIQTHALGNPSTKRAVLSGMKGVLTDSLARVNARVNALGADISYDEVGGELDLNWLRELRGFQVSWLERVEGILMECVEKDISLDALSSTVAGSRVAANYTNVMRFNDTELGGFRAVLGEGNFDKVPEIDLSEYPLVKGLVGKVREIDAYKGAVHGPVQNELLKTYEGELSAKAAYESSLKEKLGP